MKINWTLLIPILFLMISCDDSKIKFSEPQPSKTKILTKFPAYLQANYTTLTDSSIVQYFNAEYPYSAALEREIRLDIVNFIEITDKAIYNHLDGSLFWDFKLMEDSAGKAQYLNKFAFDSLANEFYQRVNYQYKVISTKDSVLVYDFHLVDTLFYSSEKNVIKKYKNEVYLNLQNTKGTWVVYQVASNKKDSLSFNTISKDDEIVLKKIMETNNEVFEINGATPSKKSFKAFVKIGEFKNKVKLKKVIPKK